MSAAYIRNRCYSERLKQTPYFTLTGRRPNLSNMRMFGSKCYAYQQDKKKLDPRCKEGIFVGYDRGSPAYLVYFPDSRKVLKHRVVRFSKVVCPTEQTPLEEFPSSDLTIRRNTDQRDLSDIEITEKNIDRPSIEQNLDVKRRYPSRERNPPSYLKDYVKDVDDDQVMSNIDYCYKSGAFPKSYKEALQSPHSEQWQAAMKDEMSSLKENDTFTLTPLPEGRTTVGGRWVYTVKENATGGETYKARYVAKGYSQIPGVDYDETFAPTANLTSIRSLMQIAAHHDLILHQMDVKTAYLNAKIDCEIYMDQAEGFEVPPDNRGKLVYRLNKSLYGLKQSGRNWNNLLHSYLLEKFRQYIFGNE